ncbi:MAG: hypothetical protein HON70_07150, partial [Lentisphaerae bacterium]|nr:hypothetical protein [Lentisphaerota bacterium]
MARNGLIEVVAGILLLAGATARTSAEVGAALARDGKALMSIVIHADAIPAERTAADELQTYLAKVTGAEFAVIDESRAATDSPNIYLGQTGFAADHKIDVAALGEEESVLRTVDGNLVITGGRPRGTLYAVYGLLEDVLGCRW